MNTHTFSIVYALLPGLEPLGVFAGESIPSDGAGYEDVCATASLECGRRSLVEWKEIFILVVIVTVIVIAHVVIVNAVLFVIIAGLGGRSSGVFEAGVIVWGTGRLAYIYIRN